MLSEASTGRKLRWLTVELSAADDGDQLPSAQQLQRALDSAGIRVDEIVHLKAWTQSSTDEDELVAELLQIFEVRDERPCISVIPSPTEAPMGSVLTVAAVPGASVRAIYEPHQAEVSFPSAAVAGDQVFVGALTANDLSGDARAQAEEVFGRLDALLGLVGASPSGIGHMFVWYQDHSVRDVINEPFMGMFTTPGDRPARHSVVRALRPGAALMIEVAGSVGSVRSCFTIGGLWHGGIGGVPNSLPFGTLCGDVLFSAGTYGRNPSDGEIPDAVTEQTRWALHYSHEFLRVAGMTAADVNQIYIWVRNSADSDEARKAVESSFMGEGLQPSIHVIQAGLPGTNQIQIELVAQR